MTTGIDFTAQVTATEELTLGRLAATLAELKAAGAPDDAKVLVRTFDGGVYEVRATWVPSRPEPGLEESAEAIAAIIMEGARGGGPVGTCGKCGRSMWRDGSAPSGWSHVDPVTNAHPAVKGRPVRDNPRG